MSAIFSVALLSALLVAQEGTQTPAKVEFKIWAVEVHQEGREELHFDPGLEEVREAVKDNRHDTYKKLKTVTHAFKDTKPVKTSLTDRYTLDVGPPVRAEDGRYRMKLRVTMKSKDKPASPLLQGDSLVPRNRTGETLREIEALSSQLLLQPEEKVVVRGLKLEDEKELVLVVSLSEPTGNEAAR